MQSLAIIGGLCLLAGTALAFAGDDLEQLQRGSAYGIGKCNNDKVKTLPAIDLAKYNGTWFETYRVPYIFEALSECVSAEYTFHPENNTVGVLNHGYRKVLNRWEDLSGVATVENPNEPAKLSIHFLAINRGGQYWVLDTDYTNYSVVYSCHEFGPFRAKNAWILSRTNQPLNADIQTKTFQTLTANGVDVNTLYADAQTGCPPRP